MILDRQSVAIAYIPAHKIKTNFLDFYYEYLEANAGGDPGHLMRELYPVQKIPEKITFRLLAYRNTL